MAVKVTKAVLRTMIAARDDLIAETAVELEQAQAKVERLKADVKQQAQNWTLLFSDYEQEQARRKRVEEALMGVWVFLCNDVDLRGNEAIKTGIEAALAEGESDDSRM